MLLYPTAPMLSFEPIFTSPESNGTASPLDVSRLATGTLSEPSIVGDSDGDFHILWVENQSKLMYLQIDSDGLLIGSPSQIGAAGGNFKWSPRITIDDSGILHMIWIKATSTNDCLVYFASDPGTDSDPTDGFYNPTYYSSNNVICKSNLVVDNIENPNIVVDSQGAAHIVWQDKDDPLDLRFGLPAIRYSMMEANWSSNMADSPIFDTLLTTSPSKSSFPEVALTDDDEVVVTWQDSRGSMVEIAILLDSSYWDGMSNEWKDMCTLLYGGTDRQGWNSPGLQSMADSAGVVLLDTIYGLGDYIPNEANSGNCLGHNTNQRSNSVILTEQSDSGGIRKLHRTIYNGQMQNGGWQYEDWGPATTWACLSWMDANGNVGNSSNPPTNYDHRWNPDATKFAIPISDEGPKTGNTGPTSDDDQTIAEAHDACVEGGVVPITVLGEVSSSTSNNMWSFARDLSQCPLGSVSSNPRTCSNVNLRNTDAGGRVSEWPSTGQNLSVMFDFWMNIIHSGSPEVWTTVLDPYAILSSQSFQRGMPAHSENGGVYSEDIGWGGLVANHFVVVNDTKITDDDSWSVRPDVEITSDGWFQFIWSDSRQGHSQSDSHELVWKRVNLEAWDFNGQATGINLASNPSASSSVEYLSPIDGSGAVGSRDADSHNSQGSIVIDDDGLMHTVWIESDSGLDTNITYRRSTDATITSITPNPWHPNGGVLGPSYDLANWQSEKMSFGGDNILINVEDDMFGPAIAVTSDNRRTAAVVWVDSESCDSGETGLPNGDHLCIRRIQRSLLQISSDVPSLTRTLEPGEQVTMNFTVGHLGATSANPMDVKLNWSGLPSDWTVTVLVGQGQGQILMDPIDANWQIQSGGNLPLSISIEAPSKIDATVSESHHPRIGIYSTDGIHGAHIELEINLDVIHNLVLSALQNSIQIEQGGSGIISINISNYGNIWEDISFPNRTTEFGRNVWGLPFGWDVDFIDHLYLLEDGTTTSKTLRIIVPDDQAPGSVNLTVVASSDKVSQQGVPGAESAYELTIEVLRKRVGNIVFELFDPFEAVLPGECGYFMVDVTKYFGDDDVRILIEQSPPEKPESISLEAWRQTHWVLNIDYSALPGGNSVEPDASRFFTTGMSRNIHVELCSPFDALAGEIQEVKLRAELYVDSEAFDEISMQVNVLPFHSLTATWQNAPNEIEPGQAFEVSILVENVGNVPQSLIPKISDNFDDSWSVEWAPGTQNDLEVGAQITMIAIVRIPIDALAGRTEVIIELHSVVEDDSFLADIYGFIEILPRVDLILQPIEGSKLDLDLRPGDIFDVSFNAINSGNLAEAPWIENHTTGAGGSLSISPRMDGLTGIETTWYVVENSGTPLALFIEIEPDQSGHLRLPLIQPGESVPVVLRMRMYGYPGWSEDYFGVRLRSESGYAVEGGDIDADEKWLTTDSNEQIINLKIFIPDVFVNAVTEELDDGDVKLQIKIQNAGNEPIENILLRICDMQLERAEIAGCDRNDAVAEQRVSFIEAAADGLPSTHVVAIRLTEPVDIVVISIDAENEVIESDESNNMMEKELLLKAGGVSNSDSVYEFATSNILLGLMVVLWVVIISLVISALRGRRRDRMRGSSSWQNDDGWGSEINKSAKKGRKMQEKVMANTPYAEVHSMDMSIKSPSSVDVSDLDIPSTNSDIKSPAEIALEPLGDEVYDPTEQKAESD
ncbi:MAG: hypothetical protein CMA77_04140, partial [Euryarchaeota archaeon]|nr:hypothetical protein [Euryarchaeota archaeon]